MRIATYCHSDDVFLPIYACQCSPTIRPERLALGLKNHSRIERVRINSCPKLVRRDIKPSFVLEPAAFEQRSTGSGWRALACRLLLSESCWSGVEARAPKWEMLYNSSVCDASICKLGEGIALLCLFSKNREFNFVVFFL